MVSALLAQASSLWGRQAFWRILLRMPQRFRVSVLESSAAPSPM